MRLYRRDGVGTETLTSTRSATVEIAGREGLESAGHTLAVGLSCLDGGSSGDLGGVGGVLDGEGADKEAGENPAGGAEDADGAELERVRKVAFCG